MNNYINIQHILEGCLLGDGHLALGKNSTNACLEYTSSSKQHCEYVHSFFKDLCTENYQEVKRRETFDIRTQKTYISFFFRTKCTKFFTEQHNRFYISKIKIIPSDLTLNSTNILFWYIGDGELNSKYGQIKLHTNSFTKEEIYFLCNKLSIYDAKSSKKTKDQFIVLIPRIKVKNFLTLIGKCPFDDYKHKWKTIDYKNKNIEKNGVIYYSNFYPMITKEYLNDLNILTDTLSKKYCVPNNCIRSYLKNRGLLRKTSTNKKIKQYDLNDNFIKEWVSATEAAKELNFKKSGISNCCKKRRKYYQKFIWKFVNTI